MSRKLQLIPGEQPKPFMTKKESRDWADRFAERVKPDLDKQRLARMRSEEAARRHMVD